MPSGAHVRREKLPKLRTQCVEGTAEELSKTQTVRWLHPQSLFRIGGCSHAALSICRLTLLFVICNIQLIAFRQANRQNPCDPAKRA